MKTPIIFNRAQYDAGQDFFDEAASPGSRYVAVRRYLFQLDCGSRRAAIYSAVTPPACPEVTSQQLRGTFMGFQFAWRAVSASAVLSSLVLACGSQGAAEPARAPAAEAAPPTPPPAPAPAEAAPAAEAEATPSRLPSEILSVPDKAWVFSFEGSAAYQTAKADCDERFKEDPAARA